MPLFGAHMSIAGGYHKAIEEAVALKCETVQLFTKSPSQWKAPDLDGEEAKAFKRLLKESGLRFPTAHDSYLINLASPDDVLYRKSIDAFIAELLRAEALGLRYLVTHPGAHMESGENVGVKRVAQALDEVHSRFPLLKVQVLLETTAGQGTTLGWRFEHISSILERIAVPERVGVCFDTCHVFAAGYALSPEPEYHATMKLFDEMIGIDQLKLFHVNDSLKPFGSRIDRHAHIGKGQLGLEPFRLLVNDSRFRKLPMILETPKEDEDRDDWDTVNLGVLRKMVAGQKR
jgi:deoxyribonuclease IV